MDETGRGTPAAGDVPDERGRLDELDRLDDAALRAIAYGRTASDTDRMRADAAARILASRADRAREADAERATAAPAASGATPGDAAAPADGLDEDADDRPSWWTRSRRIGAAVLVGAFVVGLGLSVVGERVVAALASDAPGVFDEPAPADEQTIVGEMLGTVGGGEARLLTTVDGFEIYALRTGPGGLLFQESTLGPHVCLGARDPEQRVRFIIDSCVPEPVFREQGIAGVMPGFVFGMVDSVPTLTVAVVFEWSPRGVLTIRTADDELLDQLADITEYEPVVPAPTPPGDDQASGDEPALFSTVRELPVNTTIAEQLVPFAGPLELGPAELGAASVNGAQLVFFASVHEGPDDVGSRVCLSAGTTAAFRDLECVDESEFRANGITLRGSGDFATVTIRLDPSGEPDVRFD